MLDRKERSQAHPGMNKKTATAPECTNKKQYMLKEKGNRKSLSQVQIARRRRLQYLIIIDTAAHFITVRVLNHIL
jgi:hypothetical protein